MLYQYLLALVFLVSIGGNMFPSLVEPPLGTVTSLFYFQNLFLLAPAALGLFFLGREVEEKMGSSSFLLLWVLTAVVSRFLQPGALAFNPSASVLGFLGAVVAIDPLAVTFVEVYPLPAFVTVGALLFLHFIFSQQVDVVALLLGLAFGYLFVAFKPAPPAMPARPVPRRY